MDLRDAVCSVVIRTMLDGYATPCIIAGVVERYSEATEPR